MSDYHERAVKAWETRGRAQAAGGSDIIQQRGDFGGQSQAVDRPHPRDYEDDAAGRMVRDPITGAWHPKQVSELYLEHEEQWKETTPGKSHPVLATWKEKDGQHKRWLRRVVIRQIDNGPQEGRRYKAEYEYRNHRGDLVDVRDMKLRAYDRVGAMLHQQRGGNPPIPPDWAYGER